MHRHRSSTRGLQFQETQCEDAPIVLLEDGPNGKAETSQLIIVPSSARAAAISTPATSPPHRPMSPVNLNSVVLLLSSGERHTIQHADAARMEGPFFVVSRWYADLNRRHTVLTLRSQDVIGAEILKDGVRVDYVLGQGEADRGGGHGRDKPGS